MRIGFYVNLSNSHNPIIYINNDQAIWVSTITNIFNCEQITTGWMAELLSDWLAKYHRRHDWLNNQLTDRLIWLDERDWLDINWLKPWQCSKAACKPELKVVIAILNSNNFFKALAYSQGLTRDTKSPVTAFALSYVRGHSPSSKTRPDDD